MLSKITALGYEIKFLSHAQAILTVDFPQILEEIDHCLAEFQVPITEIIGSGGGEALGTQRLRRRLAEHGWPKVNFEIKKSINGVERESISHEVDHVRELNGNHVALEIEWNNKDPFFDRDLENYKRLHAEGGISAGIIITRGTTLQAQMRDLVLRFALERGVEGFTDLEALGLEPTSRQKNAVLGRVKRSRNPMLFAEAWATHFVSDKFGAATTHWRKLQDRVDRGVGNPCPLLLIGIPASVVTFDPEARIEMVSPEDSSVVAEL